MNNKPHPYFRFWQHPGTKSLFLIYFKFLKNLQNFIFILNKNLSLNTRKVLIIIVRLEY